MSRRILKVVLQVVGLLVGMVGWAVIVLSILPFLPVDLPSGKPDSAMDFVFAGLQFALGGILCLVGHRVLFHFRPGSVRLLFAILLFLLWSELKVPTNTLFILSVIVAFALHRVASKLCCDFLFGPTTPAVATDAPPSPNP